MSHLNALLLHLSNERERLRAAKTDSERAMRTVWVAQLEREIAAEERFLGRPVDQFMCDSDILKSLGL